MHLVEENVLRGNAAIVKCLIPSFVTEYVYVASWIISEDETENEIIANVTINNDGISLVIFAFHYRIHFPETSLIFRHLLSIFALQS